MSVNLSVMPAVTLSQLRELLDFASDATFVAKAIAGDARDPEIAESIASLISMMEAHELVILSALRKAEKGSQS